MNATEILNDKLNEKQLKRKNKIRENKGDFSVTFVGKEGQFTIEGNEKCVSLDTRLANNLYPTTRYTDHGYKEVEIEILLDVSSVELFINNGEFTITSRVYLGSDYELKKDGDVELVIHDLKI